MPARKKNRVVLITGGAGFIGYHLAYFHARRDDEVHIVDNLFKSKTRRRDGLLNDLLARKNVHFHARDLGRPLKLARAPAAYDIVYHLAAVNGTRLFYEIPYTVAKTNLLSTLNLLDYLQGRKVGRLVYTSSSEVYADGYSLGLVKIPTDEHAPSVFRQPTDLRFSYGASKFMGEVLCRSFHAMHRLPFSIVRYHNIYGPRMGDKHVIPEFHAKIRRKEKPFALHGGNETRAFCHVDDAVAATHAVAISSKCKNQIVHVGNPDEEIRIRDLAGMMLEISGHKTRIVEHGPKSASVKRRCPDISKLVSATGFKPQVALRDGLRSTMAWYDKHL